MKSTRWVLAAAALWQGLALTAMAADDLMHSAPCRQALQVLSAAEADAAASGPLRAARLRAATLCLGPAAGQMDAPPAAAGAPPKPVWGIGRTITPSTTPTTTPAGADRVPRPAPRPPVSVGACDAAGCWASDGSRVQKLGPLLVGPRGVCTQTAGVLNCP